MLLVLGLMVSAFVNAQWSELGGTNSLKANNYIFAFSGNSSGLIYVGGGFKNSTGKPYVAKWDGNNWSELGGLNSINFNTFYNGIYAVLADASGNVYSAGDFTNSSSKRYVAKWDGTGWSELGGANGIKASGTIYCMTQDNYGNIYAAGSFQNSSYKSYVAKWDGTSWTELGGVNSLAANNTIWCLCSDKFGNIYAAGDFKNANSNTYIAKWDGTNWSELGGANSMKANTSIAKICVDTFNNIYAGGYFSDTTTSLHYHYVAKWDGTNWSKLGGSSYFFGYITSLSIDSKNNVYAGGLTTNSSNNYFIAKWDGANWSELGGSNSMVSIGGGIPNHSYCDSYDNFYVVGHVFNNNANCMVAKYSNNPLPLKLLSFTAQKENNNV